MIIGILRAIGVVVSTLSTTLYSAIDIAEPYESTINPSALNLRSWLQTGAAVSFSTLRTENVSL